MPKYYLLASQDSVYSIRLHVAVYFTVTVINVCHTYLQEDLQTSTGLILSPKNGVFLKVMARE